MKNNLNLDEVNNLFAYLRSQFTAPEDFLNVCQKTQSEAQKLDAGILEKLITKFQPYLDKLPPAHDLGHFRRDLLSALALSGDPFVNKMYRSDLWAGILAGAFHDIGNSLTSRHRENQNLVAHAEVGAWLFYQESEGLLSEDLRLYIAYAIAAHTHYLKPIAIDGTHDYRQPYFFGIWKEDSTGKYYGVAPTYARVCDRLDGMGGVSEAAREFAMIGDLIFDQGIAFTGDSFQKIDPQDLLFRAFQPDTILNWLQKLRVTSEFPSPYSKHDDYFSTLKDMKKLRFLENDHIIQSLDNLEINTNLTKHDLYNFLKQVSQSPKFDQIWRILEPAWDKSDPVSQARWLTALKVMIEDYQNRLNSYQKYIQNSPLSGVLLLSKTITKALQKHINNNYRLKQ